MIWLAALAVTAPAPAVAVALILASRWAKQAELALRQREEHRAAVARLAQAQRNLEGIELLLRYAEARKPPPSGWSAFEDRVAQVRADVASRAAPAVQPATLGRPKWTRFWRRRLD